MTLGDAITKRDSSALVIALEALTAELGVDALLDVLLKLPEPDANFVRPHLVITPGTTRREFAEQRIVIKRDPGQLGFDVPAPDMRWNEEAGAWDLLS